MLLNNYHVTYCTNIHPGQNWISTFESLKKHVPFIKKNVAKNIAFGLGLRLSNKASEELSQGNKLELFKSWLSENNVYVFTMNGFPYGNFHGEKVKENVHAPDWSTPERVTYTKRLFKQLSELIPKGLEGGISTSPISYKHWYKSNEERKCVFEKGAEHLIEIVLQLHEIEVSSGTYLHLDIEPEPDGLIENSDEFLDFFETYLIPIGIKIITDRLGNIEIEVIQMIKRYITMCYDICHFSLAYEEPKETFRKLNDAKINVGKIQVSAALKVLYDENTIEEIWQSLARFDEPTYLHQVTQLIDGKVKTFNDLPSVLVQKEKFIELRGHFHVPIFLEQFGALFSTQDHILKVIAYLKKHQITRHLEIETYTWDVLPLELKKELSDSIVREIKWLRKKLV